MEISDALTVMPVDHPDPRIQRIGFDLTSPYVEQCWGPLVGPSATLLLRRMPDLWLKQVPAVIGAEELSRSLGLGGGTGPSSRLMRSVERIVHHGLARWDADGTLDVRTQVPGLSRRQLDRLPDWSKSAHARLVDRHLESLSAHSTGSRTAADIVARLDRLQQPRTSPALASRAAAGPFRP